MCTYNRGLDAIGMLSLRGVMDSAMVNLSRWGFLLFCMENKLVVVRMSVIAERIQCRGELEVVGVVCHIA